MLTNYFKCSPPVGDKVYITFDDRSFEATAEAYVRARCYGGAIAAWQIPPFAGPWDNDDVVGYRHRLQILAEIAEFPNEEKLKNELQTRDARCAR